MKPIFLLTALSLIVVNSAYSNQKTMDDAGPTNPTNTNRFPGVTAQPKVVKPSDGAIINGKNIPLMPTSSPAAH